MALILQDVLNFKVGNLPPIGYSIRLQRVFDMLEDPDLDFAQLAERLTKSKKAADRLLSNAITLAKGEVKNLVEALRFLGVNTIRTFLEVNFGHDLRIRGIPPDLPAVMGATAWTHAVRVALCAQLLAEETEYPNLGHAFTAGLLHDFGAVLAPAFPMADLVQGLAIDPVKARMPETIEDRALGFNHAYLSAAIAEFWGLAPAIQAALRLHHTPSEATVGKRLTHLIHLANVAVNCHARNLPLGISLVPMDRAVLTEAGFKPEQLKAFAETASILQGQVEEARLARAMKS